jgi:hypothetical protein
MTDIAQPVTADPIIRAAGSFAIVSGIISAVGVVCLITMFTLFATPNQALAGKFGTINDICVALQYLLTIPIALALYRILLPYNPGLIRVATIVGIAAMLIVIALQLALVFGWMSFERQVGWVSLAMIGGVGAWLIITGLMARSVAALPNSVLMSVVAVPYVGYPVWAIWLGRQLLGW